MNGTAHDPGRAHLGSFSRTAYWETLAARDDSPPSVVFKLPLAACFTLPAPDREAIASHVFEIIARSFPFAEPPADTSRTSILAALNATMQFAIDTRGNLDRLVALEVQLVDSFTRLGLMHGIAGWQFPPDIRVVHPRPPDSYLARRDATDYLHCDPWRGEPADLINVVLFCEAGEQASQLELYAIPPDQLQPFVAYTGDERDAWPLLQGREALALPHRPGQLVLFDGYLPHRTRRLGNSVRISLNFSLRRTDPYASIDERWDRDRQAWHKYWFVNQARDMTFRARYERELERVARTADARALAARLAALEKYFGLRTPSEAS